MHRVIARLFLALASAVFAIGAAHASEALLVEGEAAWAQPKSAPAALLLDKATSAVDTIALPASATCSAPIAPRR
jgi:hypothetical protein